MKLILSIYDQCVVMHMPFCPDILSQSNVVLSVTCSLVVTFWEMADLFALLCVVFSCVFFVILGVLDRSGMAYVFDCFDS